MLHGKTWDGERREVVYHQAWREIAGVAELVKKQDRCGWAKVGNWAEDAQMSSIKSSAKVDRALLSPHLIAC